MKISKIVVDNYRSIKRTEVELSKFGIFVGQNNHGKTNFFEAIEWFYNAKSSDDDQYYLRNSNNTISVEIFFEEVLESDIEKLTTPASKTKIRTMLSEATAFSVVKKSTDHKRKYFIGGVDQGNPQGLDTAINEFIPKLEYINTKIRLEDVSKYKDKNPIGLMLSGVLGAIIEASDDYRKFKAQFARLFDDPGSEVRVELDKLGAQVEIYLKKQFPDGTKVRFTVNPPEFSDLLKSFDTAVDDGIETKAEDKGDGMRRAIMLSIIQAFADYRKRQVGGGTFLFMIDEAELHLHPSAQRALKRALLDISMTDQVLVNTHSSVLVVDNHEQQNVFKVEKEKGITSIKIVSDIDKINVIFELLGGSPSDLLLPRNFIIVEGKCEYAFLKAIVSRFYSERYAGIKIIFAGGDLSEQEPTLMAVHKLFSPLAGADNPIYKDKAIVLIDKPNDAQQTKYQMFKAGYPYLFNNGQVFELPTATLEEYYPQPHTKDKAGIDVLIAEGTKVKYATDVGNQITQDAFEQSMTVLFQALEASNTKGFNPR